jgi:hypothetical protein
MALNFPNNPTPNQTFVVGNRAWQWNDEIGVWEAVIATPSLIARNILFDSDNNALTADNIQDAIDELLQSGIGGGGSSVLISDTAPEEANEGDLWWDKSEGNLYVYYNQNGNFVWVEVAFGEEKIASVIVSPTPPVAANVGELW